MKRKQKRDCVFWQKRQHNDKAFLVHVRNRKEKIKTLNHDQEKQKKKK
jgi:hypothetical protein